jgi:HopA1 effector protein family
MHPELTELLDWVWVNRDRILFTHERDRRPSDKAINIIYGKYNDSLAAQLQAPLDTCLKFLDTLAELENFIQLAPVVQLAKYGVPLYVGAMTDISVSLATAAKVEANKRTEVENICYEQGIETISSFLHYRQSKDPAVERIYLNVKSDSRAEVFAWLLRKIYVGGKRIPGITNAKLAGPEDGGRADSILIYLTDDKAVESALAVIAEYQTTCGKGYFQANLPKLTKPIDGLQGVSRAQEPPQCYIRLGKSGWEAVHKSQSFGGYRASLIFEALRTTYKKDSYTAFKKAVTSIFEVAGIDPEKPSSQARLEWMGPFFRQKVSDKDEDKGEGKSS